MPVTSGTWRPTDSRRQGEDRAEYLQPSVQRAIRVVLHSMPVYAPHTNAEYDLLELSYRVWASGLNTLSRTVFIVLW